MKKIKYKIKILYIIMGCDFLICDNCKDCHCDFSNCSICSENNELICSMCIECDNNNIYNIIYCKKQQDKYGNLDYCFICDNCLKIFYNEKTVFGFTIEEHFKKNFDINFLDEAKKIINNYKNLIIDKIKKEILLKKCQIECLDNRLIEIENDII